MSAGPNRVSITDAGRALLVTRIIWAASLLGQFAFFVAVLVLKRGHQTAHAAPPAPWWGLVIITAVALPMALFLRNQIYKRYWVGDVVRPAGYLPGNLVVIAVCQALASFAIVLMMIGGSVWPHLVPMLAAMGLFVVNFPTGGPMRPHSPQAFTGG